ncbi:ras-associated and pleckstrin homology domains-containing protein 1-like [Macrobrachium rosenbergii]|uniref:ras-associated and pleckstrin homology domains-containing protein 1-like n=1 Tax=Macrobrachium rosenbergii TaxID=79674 RepID=UPI0034D5CC95
MQRLRQPPPPPPPPSPPPPPPPPPPPSVRGGHAAATAVMLYILSLVLRLLEPQSPKVSLEPSVNCQRVNCQRVNCQPINCQLSACQLSASHSVNWQPVNNCQPVNCQSVHWQPVNCQSVNWQPANCQSVNSQSVNCSLSTGANEEGPHLPLPPLPSSLNPHPDQPPSPKITPALSGTRATRREAGDEWRFVEVKSTGGVYNEDDYDDDDDDVTIKLKPVTLTTSSNILFFASSSLFLNPSPHSSYSYSFSFSYFSSSSFYANNYLGFPLPRQEEEPPSRRTSFPFPSTPVPPPPTPSSNLAGAPEVTAATLQLGAWHNWHWHCREVHDAAVIPTHALFFPLPSPPPHTPTIPYHDPILSYFPTPPSPSITSTAVPPYAPRPLPMP